MSEVHPEVNGISKDIPAEVFEEQLPVEKTAKERELEDYFAWEAAEKARKEHELQEYFAFLGRCRAREQAVRDRYAEHPGHTKRELPVWEREGINEDEKFRARLDYDLEEFRREGNEFSPAAHAVTSSLSGAEFFDNVKWDYLGDSSRLGSFKEMSPTHNESPFDLQFDYDVGVLNAYTASGNILHIRETRDPEARTREQRQLVLGMNVMTLEIKRYYAEDESTIIPGVADAHMFDEMITLQPRKLSVLSGELELDPKNKFAPLFQKAMDDASRQGLAKILRSSKGTLHFKPEGVETTFETLRPIARLDHERYLLSSLARAAGALVGERGVIFDYRLQPPAAA
ncbi:hypothetical protein D3C85_823110 [compost metagenome]